MKSISNKITTLFKKAKDKLFSIITAKGSVNEIAAGAALGTFVAVFPTFGFGILLVLGLSRFFRFNLLAAVSSSIVSNPLTSPLFIVLSFQVGSYFTDSKIDFNIKDWQHQLGEVGLTILIGSVFVSSLASLIMYFAVKYFVQKYRSGKDKPVVIV